MPNAMTPNMIDEMHQKILNSLQSMKGNADLFKRLSQAASTWNTKLQEAMEAQQAFFGVLDQVSRKAHAAPGMSSLGVGFNNLADCAKGLSEMQRDVQRSLSDEVILPLEARVPADARNVQRMGKEYAKSCTEQVDNIHRAEKEVERMGKRVRKNPADAQSMLQLRAAQRSVVDQTQELDALRAHMLRRVLTEERSRYARLMSGMLDVFKVQAKLHQRSAPALGAVIMVCQPICENPGELPLSFNPMKKRGGGVPSAAMQGYGAAVPRVAGYAPQHPAMRAVPRMAPPQIPPPGPFGGPQHAAHQPPIALKPNQYVAKYPFHGQESGQLSFAAGHVVECEGESDDNWQYGHNLMTGKQGWFPVNFLDRRGAPPEKDTAGAVELPPVDYGEEDDGPDVPGADYPADDEVDEAQNFTGE